MSMKSDISHQKSAEVPPPLLWLTFLFICTNFPFSPQYKSFILIKKTVYFPARSKFAKSDIDS